MPAHILREADRATVRFSYDADIVEALKVRIPARYRKWDPTDKQWSVVEPWVSTAINLMTEHFGRHVTVVDRRPGAEPPKEDPPKSSPRTDDRSPIDDQRRIADLLRAVEREKAARLSAQRDVARLRAEKGWPGRGSSSPDWAGELFARLPPDMRDTVYKRLLTALHPDANGSATAAVELTKQLNGAFRAPKSGR
jgi:hypothetical protein